MKFDKYIIPVPGIKVLVVDVDLTCLALVSKMLRTVGYEVVTATLASDALSIIENNELHLVLMEIHMPDMEMYELIEKITESYDLPSFVMTADDDQSSMSKALCKGAKLYFIKPILISDLRGLWQFAMWKRKDRTVASEDVSEGIVANKDQECQPFTNKGKNTLQSAKEKEQEILDKDKGEQKNESVVQKRKRITWTDGLHTKFLEAVKLAGVDAPPKRIHEYMNVPGITKQHVSSYLQKYRQTLKRQANAIQQYKKRQSSDSNLGSHHMSQKDLISCMPVQFVGTPAHFPSMEIPSVQDSAFSQNQLLCVPRTLEGDAHGTSGFGEFKMNDNGVASAEFSQVENATDGKVFNEDALLSCVDYKATTTTTKPCLARWDLLLGSDDISCVDYTAGENEMHCSTLLGNDMCQQFPPQLPVPPVPSDGMKHGICEAEAGNADEIFNISKETQQVYDQDLDIWLSSF